MNDSDGLFGLVAETLTRAGFKLAADGRRVEFDEVADTATVTIKLLGSRGGIDEVAAENVIAAGGNVIDDSGDVVYTQPLLDENGKLVGFTTSDTPPVKSGDDVVG